MVSQNNERVDRKSVTQGAPIVLPSESADFVFLRKDVALVVDEGKTSNVAAEYGLGGTGSGLGGSVPADPNPSPVITDIPQLTDIENITYQQYFDTFNSLRIRAIIKIRNSSKNKANVVGVDSRNQPNGSPTISGLPVLFVMPKPTTPVVKFDRYGSGSNMLAWGWNNVTGLGSYSSISYEWIVSTTSSSSGSKLNSGTKEYVESGSHTIGDSGVSRTYRVSSTEGDTPATTSPRWLRVRAVIVGTDGRTYYSSFSNPI